MLRDLKLIPTLYRTIENLNDLVVRMAAELAEVRADLQEQRRYQADIDINYRRLQQGEQSWRQRAEGAERRSRQLMNAVEMVRRITRGEIVDGNVSLVAVLEALEGV
jgi:predicted  nucleic acid-binding Zn-ribbon protein